MNTTSLRETTEELERSRRQVDQLQNQLNEEKQKRQELERLVEELLARLGPQSNNWIVYHSTFSQPTSPFPKIAENLGILTPKSASSKISNNVVAGSPCYDEFALLF